MKNASLQLCIEHLLTWSQVFKTHTAKFSTYKLNCLLREFLTLSSRHREKPSTLLQTVTVCSDKQMLFSKTQPRRCVRNVILCPHVMIIYGM